MTQSIKVFINYRRADNRMFVVLIGTYFAVRYGRENVFMDFESLPRFTDFENFIRKRIQEADVVVSIIGPDWLRLFEEKARRGDTDFVLLELEEALKYNKLIAPILIMGAELDTRRVPESIRAMFIHQTARLRDERDVSRDMPGLFADLEAELSRRGLSRRATMDITLQNELFAAPTGAAVKDDTQTMYRQFAESFNAAQWDAALVWASKLLSSENELPISWIERIKSMEAQARTAIEQESERQREREVADYLYGFVRADFEAGSPPKQTLALLRDVQRIVPGYDPDDISTQLKRPTHLRDRTPPPVSPLRPPRTADALLSKRRRPRLRLPQLGWPAWLRLRRARSSVGSPARARLRVLLLLLVLVLGGPLGYVALVRTAPAPLTLAQQLEQIANRPESTALQQARAGVSANEDWEPFYKQIDGVWMALVPAGCFRMGSYVGDVDERPFTNLCFDEPFWIDVYEVSNQQYGEASDCTNADDERYPRNCVDWFEAQTFCAGRGGRLPTEAEWEYVARGPDEWRFPWGNDFEPDVIVYRGNSDSLAPIGTQPDGAAWVGAQNLTGNVREWTHTIYDQTRYAYPYNASDGREAEDVRDVMRVLRGGSFQTTAEDFLRSAVRLGHSDTFSLAHTGFRCMIPLD